MDKVIIPQTKYTQLKRQAAAYQRLTTRLFESVLRDPIKEVVEDFRATELYSKDFLADLESGLRKSSYAKRAP